MLPERTLEPFGVVAQCSLNYLHETFVFFIII